MLPRNIADAAKVRAQLLRVVAPYDKPMRRGINAGFILRRAAYLIRFLHVLRRCPSKNTEASLRSVSKATQPTMVSFAQSCLALIQRRGQPGTYHTCPSLPALQSDQSANALHHRGSCHRTARCYGGGGQACAHRRGANARHTTERTKVVSATALHSVLLCKSDGAVKYP